MITTNHEESVTLVVSAWLPEQRHLRHLCESVRGDLRLEFLLTSIGPARAAAAVAARLFSSRAPVGRVVFVGTAGAYNSAAHAVNTAHCVSAARASDGAAALGASYYAGASNDPRFEEWKAGPQLFCDGPALVCVCPPSITLEGNTAHALAELGSLENLELAGLAVACAAAGVPWQAFLGVSNAVGPNAHAEWKAHHETASLAASRLAALTLGIS